MCGGVCVLFEWKLFCCALYHTEMIQLIPQTEQNLLKCEPWFAMIIFFNSIIKKFPLSVSQDSFDTKPLYLIRVPFKDIIIVFCLKSSIFKYILFLFFFF